MNSEVPEIMTPETEEVYELRVKALVNGLKHVDAPANFERRVMARIAEGPPQTKRLFGLPTALAYSLPLGLVLVVAVAFILSNRQSSSIAGSQVAREDRNLAREVVAPPTNNVNSEQDQTSSSTQSSSEHKDNSPVVAPKLSIQTSERQDSNRGGGSYEKAVKPFSPIFGKGIGTPNGASANRDEVMTSTSLPARDVLLQLGITAEFEQGWTVKKVSANSIAEHSGVKVVDIVVSLGENVLAADTVFRGAIEAASIRVRRNGKILTLALKQN